MAAGTGGSALSGRRVLLGVTGGIAAYKSAFLARLLIAEGARVQVLMTAAATRFVGPATFEALTRTPVHTDVFERTNEVLHVRLAHESDLAVVAPATANVVAKLALGIADDLLTATLSEATCPLVLAPAMHTGMWTNPATRVNVGALRERGAVVVGPVEGALAAGDEGLGRMAEPEDIFRAVVDVLARSPATSLRGTVPTQPPLREVAGHSDDLVGRRILVTAGPTYEPIDAVRFLGNRSSGKMGYAIAAEAAVRGAEVTLVSGPVALGDPPGVEVVRVETSEEMAAAVLDRFVSVDAVVMAAAVGDFRPDYAVEGKLKKEAGPPEIRLEPTVDILATLGKRKERQVLVGFAAETTDPEAEGRRKLEAKNADLLVVNLVGVPGSGFGSDTNRAAVLSRGSGDSSLRDWTKADLAREICDRIASLLDGNRDGAVGGG